MDNNHKPPADLEICILSAAYTVYCEFTDEQLSPNEFRQKYLDYSEQFSDLILGASQK